jgi:beta-galactosidase/beta-glucuronidase
VVRAHGYPRPLLQRAEWQSLNGVWDFAVADDPQSSTPEGLVFGRQIHVPFSPETPASSIGHAGFLPACWYRHQFEPPRLGEGRRLLLHFGAVDYRATVWLNGARAAVHEGGYTGFSIDATPFLRSGVAQELVVKVEDDPRDLAKPRGKQDWQLDPHSIWYPRTTGIWQTVWSEVVPRCWIAGVRWTPSLAAWELGLDVQFEGILASDLFLHVRLTIEGAVVAEDSYRLLAVR